MHCTTNDILLCFMKSSNTTCILEFDTLKIPYELNSPNAVFSHNELGILVQHKQLRGFLFHIINLHIIVNLRIWALIIYLIIKDLSSRLITNIRKRDQGHLNWWRFYYYERCIYKRLARRRIHPLYDHESYWSYRNIYSRNFCGNRDASFHSWYSR